MLGDSYLKAMSAFLSDFPPLSLGGPARLIISTGFLSFKGSNLCHFLKFTIVKLSKIGASFKRCPPSIFTERKRGGEATPTFFSAKMDKLANSRRANWQVQVQKLIDTLTETQSCNMQCFNLICGLWSLIFQEFCWIECCWLFWRALCTICTMYKSSWMGFALSEQ